MTVRGIHHVAQAEPARVALVHDGVRITYGELDAAANRIAHALNRAGVGPGDRVGVMLHNRAELFAVWNAIARLGALVVPIGNRAAEPEVAYPLDDSDAAAFVYEGGAIGAGAARAATRLRAAYAIDDAALRDHPANPPRTDFFGATVVAINYTSGTTGRPKGIARAAPKAASEYAGNAFMRFWGFDSSDVHLLCGRAYHTAPGAYAQMHLMEGARVIVMSRWSADECLALIERERVTNAHMVPAHFVRILEAEWERYDPTSVRKFLHAAAPCPPAVKRKIMHVFPPGTVWEYFGMSEGMGTVISPEEWLRKPGSGAVSRASM